MKAQNTKRIIASTMVMVALLLSSMVILLTSTGINKANAQEVEASSSELSAASGSNRFVVWQDTAGSGSGDIYLKRSTDNGATWKAAVNLSNNPGLSRNPQLAVSGTNVYVAWQQMNSDGTSEDIFLRRSTDNGATWKSKVKVATGAGCVSNNACYGLDSLVASSNSVYVVAEKNGDVYFRRSADSGATWKTIANISSNAGRSFDSDISVAGTNIYLTWTQANSAETSYDVYIRRSTDSGSSWKSKVNLSNDPSFSENADIASNGANVYVTWDGGVAYPDGHTFNGIVLKRSTDAGETWSSDQIMSELPADPETYQLDGALEPMIATVNSNVYLAWKDNWVSDEKDGHGDLLFRRSLDGGNSWEHSTKIGFMSNNDGGSICNPMTMTALGSSVYLAWASDSGCGSEYSISFSRSTDNGASWSAPDTMGDVFLDGARVDSQIEMAVSGSTVFMVITRDMAGPGYDIFVARSTNSGQTWPVAINLSKLSGDSTNPRLGL